MIGKPEWFCPRKFGWGLGIRTKEGWAYIIAAMAIVAVAAALPVPEEYRPLAIGIPLAIFLLDVLLLMPKVYANLDEREERHQLMAERSASFAAVVILAGSVLYYATGPAFGQPLNTDIMVICVLVLLGMALAKGLTLMRLEREA